MTEKANVPLAGAFGGGGLFGIGYAMGVIEGLRKQGIDLSTAPMLGTSAGSWAAAATALGVTFSSLKDVKMPRFPNLRAGVLAQSTHQVFGDAMRPNVHVVACAVRGLKRTELDGALIPLATMVAASSAVPGLFAPQSINGRLYIDGGVRSGVSVDLAAPADLLIVIAPLAGAMFGPFNNIVERNTQREINQWQNTHAGKVRLFAPNDLTAKIATLPHHLFDKARGIEAYAHGLIEGTQAI
ncbi:unannotated protein [freshwater metagenome]|uniref:Unannotated protein n=1 Tax=freshwater metagenome TaxID=449393 RepID=A0A6J6VIF3_9ZZZZ|nr:hypothetical protein [Actinomycetota bacterium]